VKTENQTTMTNPVKKKVYEVIFEADTPGGKAFDIVLLVLIVASIVAVMLESVPAIETSYSGWLNGIEWAITILFTAEFILRIWAVEKPSTYLFSFYGVIDFLAVIPTYLTMITVGAHGLIMIRALRLLRIFRVFKLTRYTSEGSVLIRALKASRTKISVFLFAVFMLVIVLGTIMYLIEGAESGFTSIPRGIYWAVVTLTTVGYGDIAPVTNLGQFVAALVMILGYGIIAVPTGIVTAEYTQARNKKITTQTCPACLREGHDPDATHCKYCGAELNP
jgi:voltage-gated potassium channel